MLTLTLTLYIAVSSIFLPKCITKDYCSADYCNNSKQHTLCKYKSTEPASHCIAYEKTLLSEDEKRSILDKMNSRRNKVAAGDIRSLPSAESMAQLEWNNELEISAQRWADQCVKHSVPDILDSCRDLGKISVGQNIATIHGVAPGLTPMALVDVWYMELLNINSSILSRYVPSSETNNTHYDYFTQLMWEETNQVGCGGVKFKERLEDANVEYRTIYRLVCNFAPAGNRRNRSVYSSGVPCSRCPLESSCGPIHTALCLSKSIGKNMEASDITAILHPDVSIEHSTELLPAVIDAVTVDTTDINEKTEKSTANMSLEKEKYTPFDYFSHLYEYTRQMITLQTKPHSCKDIMVVDNFVDLLKKKLNNDPMIKDLLMSTKSATNNNSETSFNDVGMAVFVDKVYNNKDFSTTSKSVTSDYVNSTFLVDLIEAVIFRNGDKIPVTERFSTQPLSSVQSIMVQAELAELKQNDDFTGHYFFPEEEEDTITESTESTQLYYDDINSPLSELALEDLKMSTVTKDFLDDILESDSSIDSTTAIILLSPDNINLYKSGRVVMKKFLQSIADTPLSQINK